MSANELMSIRNLFAESLLEDPNRSRLVADAPNLIQHLRKTMAHDPEDNLASAMSLDYVAHTEEVGGQNWFIKPQRFGHIRTSLLERNDAKLLNWQRKAFVATEDILCLQVASQHRQYCTNYITAHIECVKSLDGEKDSPRVAVKIEDNHDGTVNLRYTPVTLGTHELHITMYGVHIHGSPFAIHVVEPPQLPQGELLPLPTEFPHQSDSGFLDHSEETSVAIQEKQPFDLPEKDITDLSHTNAEIKQDDQLKYQTNGISNGDAADGRKKQVYQIFGFN